MGLFKKKSKDPSEIDHLKSEMASIAARLEATDAAKLKLGEQVQGISTRLEAPPESPPPTFDPAELDAVRAQLQTVADRIEQLDTRITSISNELANQITELSGDIEGLGGSEPTTELVEQLRGTQVKLANEQARYQIAFRQDLANLADFLKHT